MRPVEASKITSAIQRMLTADARLAAEVDVARSPLLNEDPSACPWVGIYRSNSQFDVRTLGFGAGARYQRTELILICMVADSNDPEAAEDAHERLVATVLDVLFADPTLGGVVRTLNLASIQYQLISTTDDQLMHAAEIHVVVETVTQ